MRLFRCTDCSHLIFFENTSCIRCGAGLVFDPRTCVMRTQSAATAANERCQGGIPNCNWLASEKGGSCLSCAMTVEAPREDPQQLAAWGRLEAAKQRLLYALLRLNLPLTELRFAFPTKGMTGHASGLITIVLSEADDAKRERRRIELHEPLRTLIGHFRHESGHFFFDRLGVSVQGMAEIRSLFGDERTDYAAALKQHYAAGAPADWQDHFISSYATAHPCEDWAETWAHYLHMVDAVELARAYGLQLAPTTMGAEGQSRPAGEIALAAASEAVAQSPLGDTEFSALVDAWLPLTYFGNSLNRSLGLQDWYPFVLNPTVLKKLGLLHRLLSTARLADVATTPASSSAPSSSTSLSFSLVLV